MKRITEAEYKEAMAKIAAYRMQNKPAKADVPIRHANIKASHGSISIWISEYDVSKVSDNAMSKITDIDTAIHICTNYDGCIHIKGAFDKNKMPTIIEEAMKIIKRVIKNIHTVDIHNY